MKQFEIQNIIANTHNTEAQTKLTEIQTQINDVNAKIQRATAEEQMNIITTTMLKQSQELEILRNQRYISDETENTIIDQTKAALAQTYVETELKRQGITESKAKVEQIYQQIQQGWKKLSNDAKELELKGMQWETNQQDAITSFAFISSSHHHIITSPHHPTSNMQKICEKLIITSPHHHITSFFLISGFSSTKFSGVRLGIKRSERSNISTKKALYNNIIIGFCSESTEYKLKG